MFICQACGRSGDNLRPQSLAGHRVCSACVYKLAEAMVQTVQAIADSLVGETFDAVFGVIEKNPAPWRLGSEVDPLAVYDSAGMPVLIAPASDRAEVLTQIAAVNILAVQINDAAGSLWASGLVSHNEDEETHEAAV